MIDRLLTTTEQNDQEVESDYEWKLIVDIRSAIGIPLNHRTEHGLPSTRIQIDYDT